MTMPVETFLTALYPYVDDWYQTEGARLLAGKVGKKPEFADSGVLTLSLAQHGCGFSKEAAWLRFVRQNYLPLFPRLLSQSEFNRRARDFCWLLNRLRLWAVQQLEAFAQEYRLTDGTPIHVRHWRRYGQGHLQLREAALGYGASKRETFYGYRYGWCSPPWKGSSPTGRWSPRILMSGKPRSISWRTPGTSKCWGTKAFWTSSARRCSRN